MPIQSVETAEVAGKRVLVRVDFNVPVTDGRVTDDTRIKAALPTIEHLVERGAKVVLMSHFGRPRGTGFEADFSLAPAAARLSELIGRPVTMASDVTGEDARAKVAELSDGAVVLLENLRFDAREKKNDPTFCEELAAFGDLYVNDAFGCAHRAHASTTGVAKLLPAYAGFLLSAEVETLSSVLDAPERPFVAILGGSKVSDKVGVIESLMDKADVIIVGGGMCFTFLLGQGKAIGASLKEDDWVDRSQDMLARAEEVGCAIMLPEDVVCADRFAEDANVVTCSVEAMPADMMGLDIGPATEASYAAAIARAKTVFWNGPMGVFEMKPFAHGTKAVADAMAANEAATTIVGGGDSVAAVNMFGMASEMSFISTGGGAAMELVEGKALPGVEALRR